MGNTSGGHKRRPSLEDDFPPGTMSNKRFQGAQDTSGDDSVISILTEGIAINAIADQLRDSRLCGSGEKAMLYVGGGTDAFDDSQAHQSVPTVFKWEGGGKDVYISGTFNGWKSKIPMVRSSSKRNFYTIVDLPLGEHQYKFIVDGQWKLDQKQPVTTSAAGVQNNVIEVKESDFDVLTALSHDMASSRNAAPEDNPNGGGTGNTPGTPQRGEITGHETSMASESDTSFLPVGSSPPGDYGRVIPTSPQAAMHVQTNTASTAPPTTNSHHSSGDSKKPPAPPLLPPQLLQYADHISWLRDDAQTIQHALDRLPIEISGYGMQFALSECKVLFEDWQGPMLAPALCGDRLESVDNLKAAGGGVGKESRSAATPVASP